MSRDLVVFGEDWGRHPSSTQHLIRQLAIDRKVIWVNSIGLRRPKFSLTDFGRLAKKLWRMTSRSIDHHTSSQPQNMSIVEPKVIPVPSNRLAIAFNRMMMGKALRKVMKKKNIYNPVLWASLPTVSDLIGICDERAVIYYCGDDFGALAGVDHQPVQKCEQQISAKADLILAASEALSDKFDQTKTKHLPHGVDLALFIRPSVRAKDLPAKGPVAGFYGSLSEWLDQDLIVQCARRMPNWSFVFVGTEHIDVSRLRSMANIHLLGPRPHDQLPRYVQHWDVSLMPFLDTAQIQACNPLKLREYLAAGRPIVATPFPALDAYDEYIVQAHTSHDFEQGLITALGESVEVSRLRRSSVQSESWTARADAIGKLIDAL